MDSKSYEITVDGLDIDRYPNVRKAIEEKSDFVIEEMIVMTEYEWMDWFENLNSISMEFPEYIISCLVKNSYGCKIEIAHFKNGENSHQNISDLFDSSFDEFKGRF